VIASVAAYREGGPWRDHVLGILDRNRHLMADLIAEHLPLARYAPPGASYLAWIDLSAYQLGPDPSVMLLKEAKVAVNAGPTFGAGGDGHVRLNMATSPAILTRMLTQMGEAVRANE
jgi:cystathionine beta-lyase